MYLSVRSLATAACFAAATAMLALGSNVVAILCLLISGGGLKQLPGGKQLLDVGPVERHDLSEKRVDRSLGLAPRG
jgi:hypothetical protein